jgi:hypothetical protein
MQKHCKCTHIEYYSCSICIMRVLSFDVGIKNMAYCLFDVNGCDVTIVDWNVINLMNKEPDPVFCTEAKTTKKKKDESPEACGKKAKWRKGEKCYCEKHAKSSTFLVPELKYSLTKLKKLKADELRQLATSRFIELSNNDNKPVILEKVARFFSEISLEPIHAKKTNAGELDLFTIGRNMKTEFDQIPVFRTVTHVIIENQISPIATRMKTIQGMLMQYFIMRRDDSLVIEFLSSAGKLKGFEKQNENVESEYAQHKKDAVFYCARFLETERFSQWKHVLETKKKDDLADCFLQGIHWLKRQNITLVA